MSGISLAKQSPTTGRQPAAPSQPTTSRGPRPRWWDPEAGVIDFLVKVRNELTPDRHEGSHAPDDDRVVPTLPPSAGRRSMRDETSDVGGQRGSEAPEIRGDYRAAVIGNGVEGCRRFRRDSSERHVSHLRVFHRPGCLAHERGFAERSGCVAISALKVTGESSRALWENSARPDLALRPITSATEKPMNEPAHATGRGPASSTPLVPQTGKAPAQTTSPTRPGAMPPQAPASWSSERPDGRSGQAGIARATGRAGDHGSGTRRSTSTSATPAARPVPGGRTACHPDYETVNLTAETGGSRIELAAEVGAGSQLSTAIAAFVLITGSCLLMGVASLIGAPALIALIAGLSAPAGAYLLMYAASRQRRRQE
jgi:hypothetical protein